MQNKPAGLGSRFLKNHISSNLCEKHLSEIYGDLARQKTERGALKAAKVKTMREILPKHVLDNSLTMTINTELLATQKQTIQWEKMGKGPEEAFLKTRYTMTSKHARRCSKSEDAQSAQSLRKCKAKPQQL